MTAPLSRRVSTFASRARPGRRHRRPGHQPDRGDRPRHGRLVQPRACATPTTPCSTRRFSTSARRSRSTWGTGTDLEPALLGEITAIEPSFPADGPPTITVPATTSPTGCATPSPSRAATATSQRQPDRRPDRRRERPDPDRRPDRRSMGAFQVESDMAFLKERAEHTSSTSTSTGTGCTSTSPAPDARTCWSGDATCPGSPRASPPPVWPGCSPRVQPGARPDAAVASLAGDLDPTTWWSASARRRSSCSCRWSRKSDPTADVETLSRHRRGQVDAAESLDGLYEGTGTCIGIPDLSAGTT